MRRPGRSLCIWLGVMLMVAMLAGACAPEPDPPATGPTTEPTKEGGTLKVAIIGNPPTLDVMVTTASVVHYTMWHVFEPLFTMDANYDPIPHLVDTWSVSEDGLTYEFNLRQGVPFHNGREMTAADAVASLERFGTRATWGKNLFEVKDSLTAEGDHKVVLKLTEPVAIVPLYLTSTSAVVMPKEIVEAAGDGHVEEFIGTGPFEYVEYQPDQHIKLKRFEDYASRDEAPNGYGGGRTAYVDELLFVPVDDVAVRIAGVQAGDFHFGEWIQPDEYERLLEIPEIETKIIKPSGWTTAVFNKGKGMMADAKMRQAILAALDMEPIMKAAYGHEDFWRLDSGVLFQEQTMYSDAGNEFYNQADPERARQLAAEAGYNGEPIRWLTTQQYPAYYTTALVAKEQLEEAGFNIDLQVVDWATIDHRRTNPDLYEIFSTAFGITWDPVLGLYLSPNWPSEEVGYRSEAMQSLLAEMRREADPEARYALWEQAQQLFWEDVPVIKFGDYFLLHIHRPEVKDYQGMVTAFFWNVWLETE